MQDLPMQVERLEKVVDGVFEQTQAKLGIADPVTKQVLPVLMYIQGLKYDVSNLQPEESTCGD